MKNPKQEILGIIKSNLENSETYNIFLFGSRVRGDYKKHSDYDIGIRGTKKLDFFQLMEIRNKLQELPYLVDLIDFNSVDTEFSKIASQNIQKWN